MSDQQKNQEQLKQQQAFRGVVIPISKDSKFGLQISGDVSLLELYAALSLLMERLQKDLEAK